MPRPLLRFKFAVVNLRELSSERLTVDVPHLRMLPAAALRTRRTRATRRENIKINSERG